MLNYEFPPLGGGAGNANFYLLKEFAKNKKLEIDLVTSSIDKFTKEKFSHNITLHRLNIGKGKKNLQYQISKDLIVYFIKALLYSKKLMKKKNYDLIHAWFGIPCGLIALLLGKPYIVSLRGSDVPFYNPRFYLLDKFIFRYLSKFIWKKAKTVTTNSEGLKILAKKTSTNQKIEVIYNGVDTKEFKPAKNKKFGKTLKIICVARLIKRKGIDYLLKALGELKNKDYLLTIIGDGNEKENLKQLAKELKIKDKVNFLGAIPHSKMACYYQQNDLFVLPSLNEGMSNTILEAMACGLPIITTNTGGAKELIKNNGFIVKPKSVTQLKNAILKYLNNKNLLEKHRQISRQIAKKMSWQKAAKGYLKIYAQLA